MCGDGYKVPQGNPAFIRINPTLTPMRQLHAAQISTFATALIEATTTFLPLVLDGNAALRFGLDETGGKPPTWYPPGPQSHGSAMSLTVRKSWVQTLV